MPSLKKGNAPKPTSSRQRPKHVPQRTCVVCRDSSSKRTLTRIVRGDEGVVTVDPTGRANGRGAYICDKPACWQRAVSTPILNNALRTTVSAESLAQLKQYADGLARDDSMSLSEADAKETTL